MYQTSCLKMISVLFVVPLGCMLAVPSVATSREEVDQTGSIHGQLTNVKGHAVYTGNAVVFLCDAKSGMPYSPETRKVIDLGSEAVLRFDQYWHAVTSDTGNFQFKNVPVGTYRLVAQSWAGISGVPRAFPKSKRTDPGNEPSSLIILHGVAESVVVKANEKTLAYPRQWGEEMLRIETDPQASHNFLLISRNPRLGEGVLGPVGWGQEFIAGIIGITRMEDPQVTLIGLPKGATIYTGLLNYDNSPGMGGASFVIGSDHPATLPIYAAWSNGKYHPSPRLEKLTLLLEEKEIKVAELTGLTPKRPVSAYVERAWSTGANQVEVPGYGKVSVIDLLAAESFRNLKKFHRQRGQRRPQKKVPATPQDDSPDDK